MHDDGTRTGDLRAGLEDAALTPGQRKRLSIFQSVEAVVCSRIEEICGGGGLDVTDVAALVIAPAARGLFFDEDEGETGVSVVIGHRNRVRAFLQSSLPASPDAPSDPYADLLEPAPPRCVRVMVIDDQSLTVMSYGTFVTVEVDLGKQAVA